MTIIASPMNFFGMDGLLIFFILLLLFGAKKLPELARGLGQAIKEFSKAKDEFSNEMTRPIDPPVQPPVTTAQLESPKPAVTEVHPQHDDAHARVVPQHEDAHHRVG